LHGGDSVLAVVFEGQKVRHGFQVYFSGLAFWGFEGPRAGGFEEEVEELGEEVPGWVEDHRGTLNDSRSLLKDKEAYN